MAEPVSIVASVIAIIQISDRVINICRHYISTMKDAPSDIQTIVSEIATLKIIFERLEDLVKPDGCGSSQLVDVLTSDDGPIKGCHRSITQLEALLSQDNSMAEGSKKRKLNLAALAWPLKQNKVNKLRADMARYRDIVALAINTESMYALHISVSA